MSTQIALLAAFVVLQLGVGLWIGRRVRAASDFFVAGRRLPALLVFSVADTSFMDAVNSEVVASEIVATLVGSIGLIVAVPVTTALAALLATRVEAHELPAEEHAHAH